MYHNNHPSFSTTMDKYNNRFDQSEYCNSVIDCTNADRTLSEVNVIQLLSDHGQSYYEYAEDCGHDYHANTILTWLGY